MEVNDITFFQCPLKLFAFGNSVLICQSRLVTAKYIVTDGIAMFHWLHWSPLGILLTVCDCLHLNECRYLRVCTLTDRRWEAMRAPPPHTHEHSYSVCVNTQLYIYSKCIYIPFNFDKKLVNLAIYFTIIRVCLTFNDINNQLLSLWYCWFSICFPAILYTCKVS